MWRVSLYNDMRFCQDMIVHGMGQPMSWYYNWLDGGTHWTSIFLDFDVTATGERDLMSIKIWLRFYSVDSFMLPKRGCFMNCQHRSLVRSSGYRMRKTSIKYCLCDLNASHREYSAALKTFVRRNLIFQWLWLMDMHIPDMPLQCRQLPPADCSHYLQAFILIEKGSHCTKLAGD